MQRKEKTLTLCECGRHLAGKLWMKQGGSLQEWARCLARRALNRVLKIKVEKCPFCKGELKERDYDKNPLAGTWEW